MRLGTDFGVIDAAELTDRTRSQGLSATRTIVVEPSKRSRLVFVNDPESLAVEQYRLLCRRLCTAHPTGGVILVTSPSPGEGKTLTSINLAWCLAESGHATGLVDLDFRAPGVAPVLGYVPSDAGTEDVLSGKRTLIQALRRVEGLPLYVLCVRHRINSPATLLRHEPLATAVRNLRNIFDWVILDLAPAIPMADVAEVAPHVDGALLVVRSGKTAKALITPTVDLLGQKLWGAVLNDTVINGSSYYGYYGDHNETPR